mgnify:FL=1
MDAVFGITQERLVGHKSVVVSHSFACCRFMGVHGFLPHNDEEKTKTSAKKDGGYGLSHELVTVKKRLSRMLSPAEKARRPSVQESETCHLFRRKLFGERLVSLGLWLGAKDVLLHGHLQLRLLEWL